jgi:hypothetical protein
LKDYYLPACVVLAAAVINTRAAYQSAMNLVKVARKYDPQQFAKGGERKSQQTQPHKTHNTKCKH